jgi:Ca2+-binding RTX toxin-like protein
VLDGGEGDDVFWPGLGDDAITGGRGVDLVDFFHPADPNGVFVDLSNRLASGHGSKQLATVENVLGTPYADELRGSWDANFLFGRGGDDVLWGLGANDVLWGGPGADVLWGGAGDDALYAHDDTCVDDLAADQLVGEGGLDTGYGVLATDIFDPTVENVIACP